MFTVLVVCEHGGLFKATHVDMDSMDMQAAHDAASKTTCAHILMLDLQQLLLPDCALKCTLVSIARIGPSCRALRNLSFCFPVIQPSLIHGRF